MTKETENHVITRTMELKGRNKIICYPKLCEADFDGCNVGVANRIISDLKFDADKIRECDTRDYKKKLKDSEERQKEKENENA